MTWHDMPWHVAFKLNTHTQTYFWPDLRQKLTKHRQTVDRQTDRQNIYKFEEYYIISWLNRRKILVVSEYTHCRDNNRYDCELINFSFHYCFSSLFSHITISCHFISLSQTKIVKNNLIQQSCNRIVHKMVYVHFICPRRMYSVTKFIWQIVSNNKYKYSRIWFLTCF